MAEYILQQNNKVKRIPYNNLKHSKVYTLRMSKNPNTDKPYSFREIGDILGISGERARVMYNTYIKKNSGKILFRGGDL